MAELCTLRDANWDLAPLGEAILDKFYPLFSVGQKV